ncbi:hypothetical protein SAMN02746000_01139 [Paracoccus sp. J56]|nr:hypothetical protein SAMN02746000_01139 [Paracoccus sp. J56]
MAHDFRRFRLRPLTGPASGNKGTAQFPAGWTGSSP